MATPRVPKFQVYRDKSRSRKPQPFRWRLRAPNGMIIADSAEGYTRRRRCREAALTVKRLMGARNAVLVDV
jgi:uncharacterized protein YegP (UPF0339 family)